MNGSILPVPDIAELERLARVISTTHDDGARITWMCRGFPLRCYARRALDYKDLDFATLVKMGVVYFQGRGGVGSFTPPHQIIDPGELVEQVLWEPSNRSNERAGSRQGLINPVGYVELANGRHGEIFINKDALISMIAGEPYSMGPLGPLRDKMARAQAILQGFKNEASGKNERKNDHGGRD